MLILTYRLSNSISNKSGNVSELVWDEMDIRRIIMKASQSGTRSPTHPDESVRQRQGCSHGDIRLYHSGW